MRPDFKHLLTERERYLSRWVKENQGEKKILEREEAHLEYEDWAPGRKIGMKKNHFGTRRTTKSLSENLSPLANFLRTSVGRKWDEVFSEINEACPNDSAVSAHIYSHLWHFVVRKPLITEEGKVYDTQNLGGYMEGLVESKSSYPRFYVHPETNILLEAPRTTKRLRKLKTEGVESTFVPLKNKNFAAKIKGIWYETVLEAIPKPVLKSTKDLVPQPGPTNSFPASHTWYEYPQIVDKYLLKEEGYRSLNSTDTEFLYNGFVRWCQRTYKRKVYCKELKQMNSKELKQANLENDSLPTKS